jgi:hypothetical protein
MAEITCSICSDIDGGPGYYASTCSKECARIARLVERLDWRAQTLREILMGVPQ